MVAAAVAGVIGKVLVDEAFAVAVGVTFVEHSLAFVAAAAAAAAEGMRCYRPCVFAFDPVVAAAAAAVVAVVAVAVASALPLLSCHWEHKTL